MVTSIDEYVNSFEGEKKAWLETFIAFMRDNYPDIPEKISYQIPTFKWDRMYIAFSVASKHFTFHTLDFEMIEEIKPSLPEATFGKGSAKIPFHYKAAMPVLFEVCRRIVERSRTATPDG